ncbi:hypothetical protein [Oceanobacillus sp. CAU 1775]
MSKINFHSFRGRITQIEDMIGDPNDTQFGCLKFITVENNEGLIVNFIAGPDTYFYNHEIVSIGDWITGYYDGDVPVILIYPPQYKALVIVKESPYENAKVDYFDEQLLSSDGSLRLNISSQTPIYLTNAQPFTASLSNRNLIVSYGPTTKSIPAQTTPYEVIVFCRET